MTNHDATLPASVQAIDGPGGLPLLQVTNRHMRAVVSLQGAHLMSFVPTGGPDWLYLSPRAVFAPGQPIRGGVPLCWPWFGPDPLGLERPAHGFARLRRWALQGAADEADGSTRLTFGLTDDEASRALWPHAFTLTFTLHLGAMLGMALTTHNRGDQAFKLTQALHSYFAIDHIDTVQVLGLRGCRFIDKVPGTHPDGAPADDPLRITGRLDRVYQGVPERLRLLGAAGGGARVLCSEGSRTAVVWNPGAELASSVHDLGPDTHHRFVCVETANAGAEVLTLQPGERHRIGVTVTASAD